MASSVIKYVTINEVLYRIEEYSYRGYADSIHTGSTTTKVPDDQVETIRAMLKKQEKNNEV